MVKRGRQMIRPKSTSNVLNSGRGLFNWILQYQIRRLIFPRLRSDIFGLCFMLTTFCYLGFSMTLIVGIAAMHKFFPRIRPYTRKFFFLSYASPTDHGTIYTQGIDHIYFVSAWVVLFTVTRAITVEWLLQPLARILGVAKRSHLRFAEQVWIFLYYCSIWSLGMVWAPLEAVILYTGAYIIIKVLLVRF